MRMVYVLYHLLYKHYHTVVKIPGNPYYLRQRRLCFGRFGWFVCLSTGLVTMNGIACMKL